RLRMVRAIAGRVSDILVLTKRSARILMDEYGIADDRITVVPHGTHPVPPGGRAAMKRHHGVEDRTVLTTFGLLSPNKGVETAIEALPAIVARHPDALYLV